MPKRAELGALILGSCALAACQGESPVEPLGLRVRERPELGPVAEAIRRVRPAAGGFQLVGNRARRPAPGAAL